MENETVSSVVTVDFVRARLRHYFMLAAEELRKAGPDSDTDMSNFMTTATIILPGGSEGDVRIGFKGAAEKEVKMLALSETCKAVHAAAVLVRMAATMPDVGKIAKEIHLHIPTNFSDRAQQNYFEEKLFAFVKKKTGGSSRFGMLPRDYIRDVSVVAAVGPLLPDIGLFAEYKWENGLLTVKEPHGNEPGMQTEFGMVPKWWD